MLDNNDIMIIVNQKLLPVRHAARPRAGLFFYGGCQMPSEPLIKRAVAFIDGQNLYHAARESFGYTYPNFDVKALSQLFAGAKVGN